MKLLIVVKSLDFHRCKIKTASVHVRRIQKIAVTPSWKMAHLRICNKANISVEIVNIFLSAGQRKGILSTRMGAQLEVTALQNVPGCAPRNPPGIVQSL
jgi:hypothetical protein